MSVMRATAVSSPVSSDTTDVAMPDLVVAEVTPWSLQQRHEFNVWYSIDNRQRLAAQRLLRSQQRVGSRATGVGLQGRPSPRAIGSISSTTVWRSQLSGLNSVWKQNTGWNSGGHSSWWFESYSWNSWWTWEGS